VRAGLRPAWRLGAGRAQGRPLGGVVAGQQQAFCASSGARLSRPALSSSDAGSSSLLLGAQQPVVLVVDLRPLSAAADLVEADRLAAREFVPSDLDTGFFLRRSRLVVNGRVLEQLVQRVPPAVTAGDQLKRVGRLSL